MTPNLMKAQIITITTAIVGACLISFITALLVLAYGEQIQNYIVRRRVWHLTNLRRQTLMQAVGGQLPPSLTTQTRSSPHIERNPEMRPRGPAMFAEPPLPLYLSPPMRNPSGTYRLNMGMIRPCPMHHHPEEPWVYQELAPRWVMPIAGLFSHFHDSPPVTSLLRKRTVTPIPQTLLPRDDPKPQSPNSKRTMTPSTPQAPTSSGPNSLPLTNKSLDLSEPRHGNSNNGMSSPKKHTLGQESKSLWGSTSPSTKEPLFHVMKERQSLRPESLPITTEPYIPQPLGTEWRGYAPEQPRNNANWRSPYLPSLYNRGTDQTWTGSMTSSQFNHFNYDYETFRGLDKYSPDLSPLLQPLPNALPHGFTVT
ncbi:hypothetical protein EDD85DRAFT_798821 [Armillaria nabsnona]|nr:hypothetical protein EDD85DRAFT_798821 [Armillaria nabsnona]